jgi:hypothetical protein
MKKHWILSLILAIFLLNIGCSTLQLESTWKDRDITLDGKGGDWLGAKYYFEESGISVGLINDERSLFISMMTENPMIRAQVMRQGLTVWIDPKGGKGKTFGIRYPLGRQIEEGENESVDPQEMMDEMTREEMIKKLQESMTELEVLGPNEKVLGRMAIDNVQGIEVKMRNAAGTFVYELKVPLASSEEYPFALGVAPGDSIGVGFLSPKMQMRRPGGGRGGGRMAPGGGMYPGGGRGGMGGYGMRPIMPQDLKIWAKVRLASGSFPALAFF